MDHFFNILFDNTLYGSKPNIHFGESWAIEVVCWLELWCEIHPGIVYEKVVSLARYPEHWKPLLRTFKDAADFAGLYWLESVVSEATNLNSLAQELVDLVEDCLNSYLQSNSTRTLAVNELEQIAQLRSRLAGTGTGLDNASINL